MTATISPPVFAFKFAINSSTFNSAFSQLTNDVNSHITEADFAHPSLAAATPNMTGGTLGTIVKRGATLGEASVGYLAVAPLVASASTVIQAAAPLGHTGTLIAALVNGVSQFAVTTAGGVVLLGAITAGSGAVAITDATGHLDMTKGTGVLPAANGGTGVGNPAVHGLLVAQGAGPMTVLMPGAAGNILTSNGTDVVSAATIPTKTLAEFALSAGVAAMTSQVAAGKWQDTAGTSLVFAGATVTHPTAPVAPNSRWDAVSLPPGATNSATVTAGNDATYGHPTDVGNPPTTRPNIPPGNTLVGYVLVPGGGGVIPAANVDDGWRNTLPGGGTGGGGAGGGIPTTAAVITNGDQHLSYPNSLSVQGVLGGYSTDGSSFALVKSGQFDGALGDLFRPAIQPDIAGRIRRNVSGATVTIPAGATEGAGDASPVTLAMGGTLGLKLNTNTAATAATAAGGAGYKTLLATLATGLVAAQTVQFTLRFVPQGTTPNVYEIPICDCYFDGTNVVGLSFKRIGAIYSHQVLKESYNATNGAGLNDTAFNASAFAKPANMNTSPAFTLAEINTSVDVENFGMGFWSATAPGGVLFCRARFTRQQDGAIQDAAEFRIGSPAIALTTTVSPSTGTATAVTTEGGINFHWSGSRKQRITLAQGTWTFTQVWQANSPAVSDLYDREVGITINGLPS